MRIALHFTGPAQESPEFVAFAPHELPELQETDLLHLDACIGLDTPEKIGAAPGSQAMAPSGIPEEADLVAHELIININSKGLQAP